MSKLKLEFKQYSRKGLSELRPFVVEDTFSAEVSISAEDQKLPTLIGGYVARNPKNHKDLWYVAKKYFDDNLELYADKEDEKDVSKKSLGNTDANGATKNVKDIVFFGNGDTFKLISKASSVNEGWMKSTKAMQIHGVGCVIQVTTQQGDNVSEALTFVPGVKIWEKVEDDVVVSREIVVI